MIKGTEKKVVVVKCDAKSCIDEAFFILKPCAFRKTNSDIITEANKLITAYGQGRRRRFSVSPRTAFITGVCITAALSLIIRLW